MPQAGKASADRRDRRLYAVWAAGLLLLLLVGLFCWLVLGPFLQAKAALKAYWQSAPPEYHIFGRDEGDRLVETLGGRERALRCLKIYVTMPDRIAENRHYAARCMAYCGEPSATKLVTLLQNKDARMRSCAAQGLSWLGTKAASAQPQLLRAMSDDNAVVRAEAARAILRTEPKASLALTAFLPAAKDCDPEVRRIALAGLSMVKPPSAEVIDAIMGALGDRNEDVREAAGKAFRWMGEPVLDRVIRKLEDTNPQIREAAVTGLGEMWLERKVAPQDKISTNLERPKAAVPAMTRLLSDPDVNVRAATAHALGEYGKWAIDAADALSRALDDPDVAVRIEAAVALSRVSPKSEKAVLELTKWLEEACTASPEPNRPRWTKLFDEGRTAAEALAEFGPEAKSAVPALIRALGSKNEFVRESAAKALGATGDARAVEPLISVLKDPDVAVRRRAVGALRGLKDPRAIGPLQELRAEDPNKYARKEAESAIRAIEAAATGQP